VLGVHRQDPGVPGLGQTGHQLAADDQRLLVRQRDIHPLSQRDDRWPKPGGADDAVQHEIGARGRDQLPDALLAGEHASVPGLARLRGGRGLSLAVSSD
jgi:hypothetical protein